MRSAEEIIEKLKGSFNTPSTKDEKVKVVVFCIIISTTFWFFSALNKSDYVTQISYPIKLVYNDSSYIALSELPDRLPLEVAGGGWDLMTRSFGFNMQPLEIELDDPTKETYKLTNSLRQEIAPLLEPVTINYILIDSISYDIDKRVSKKLPVVFDSAAVVLDGQHKITSPVSISPDSIIVSGAQSLIELFSPAIVIHPGPDEFDQSINRPFSLADLNTELVSTNVKEVNVNFEVTEYVLRSVELPVYRMNFKKLNPTVTPSKVFVTYEMEASNAQELDSTDLILTIDYLNLQRSDSTIPIEITLQAPFILNPKLSQSKVKLNYE